MFFFYLASQKEKRLFSHLPFRRTTSLNIYNVLRFVPFFPKKRTPICDNRLQKNSFHLNHNVTKTKLSWKNVLDVEICKFADP